MSDENLPFAEPRNRRGVARIYLASFIPLHSYGHGIEVNGPFDEFIWWEGFKHYRSWVQILILLRLVSLRIIEDPGKVISR